MVADPGPSRTPWSAGDAAALDAWLWRRGDDAGITVAGDRGLYTRFRGAVNNPIN